MPALPDMVGMVVQDIGESLRFYRLLGLDIPQNPSFDDYFELITPNGYRLSWNTEALARSLNPNWQTPLGQRISLAFKFNEPSEVDAAFYRLVQAGYVGQQDPWDAFWGQRYAVVQDPDGNHVDLFAPL